MKLDDGRAIVQAVSRCASTVSISVQCALFTQRYWDKFLSGKFVFPLLVSFHYCPIFVGRDSAVSITTRYGLDCPGIESGYVEVFHTHTHTHTQTDPLANLHNVYRVSFQGVKRPESGTEHPPDLAPRLKRK